jgi:HAD superfamily hydrolase (TIGR01544 family)
MENVIIRDKNELDRKIKCFKKDGHKMIHVISDFDRTLTKAYINGKKFPSIISQLYDGNHLTKEYTEKARELQSKYYPIEIDQNIPLSEKSKAMEEWWIKHKLLLIESKLNISDVKNIVDNSYMEFRERLDDFLDKLHENNIPLIIFSSSGIGETIGLYFKKIKRDYQNIHIITNSMIYDNNGYAIDYKKPIIHVLNKGEIALKELPIMKKIIDRKNVILIGDSIGDLGMVEGFPFENIIKIGFLNENVEANKELYRDNFDFVIINDSDFSYVNIILEKIIGKKHIS